MALQLDALRDALIEAGASREKAAAAAEEIAAYKRNMADLRLERNILDKPWMPFAVVLVSIVAIFISGIALSHWLPPRSRSITVHVIMETPQTK